MSISEEQVTNALKSVKYPGFTRDIVSFGLVKSVHIDDGEVKVQLALATNDPNVPAAIKNDAESVLRGIKGVRSTKILIDIHAPPAGAGTGMGAMRIPGIKHVFAVASGKGGVGKSTVAANLAVALEQTGARVGLCDCDIYGPSISLMFGTRERPTATEENKIVPIEQYGLRLMSMGFLLDDTSPAILRGPMVTRYTQQFLRQVEWGELDYLVLDLPPGTGDIQLTIVQTVALSGAIIVTTPQEVALIDARKAATMFEKVNVARARLDRKYELLHVSVRRKALRHLWKRRRRTRSQAVARSPARSNSYRYRHTRSGRSRDTGRERRSAITCEY